MKAASRSAAPVRCSSPRTALGQHAAGIERDQMIKAPRLVHVGGRHDHAHAGALGADAGDQLPELRARADRRLGRLVEHQQVGVVDQRAAQAELLLHAARELARRPLQKARSPVARVRASMRRRRSAASWPNRRAKNCRFSSTDSVG